jgi:hypothetical protein
LLQRCCTGNLALQFVRLVGRRLLCANGASTHYKHRSKDGSVYEILQATLLYDSMAVDSTTMNGMLGVANSECRINLRTQFTAVRQAEIFLRRPSD